MQVITVLTICVIFLSILFFVERRRSARLRRRCGRFLDVLTEARMSGACSADNCNYFQYRLADFAAKTFGIPYPCYEGTDPDDDESRMKPGDVVTFTLKNGGEVLTGEIEANIDDEGNMLPRCPVCVYESGKDVRYQLDGLSNVKLEKRPDNFTETLKSLEEDGYEV